jgi:hypothetical protein
MFLSDGELFWAAQQAMSLRRGKKNKTKQKTQPKQIALCIYYRAVQGDWPKWMNTLALVLTCWAHRKEKNGVRSHPLLDYSFWLEYGMIQWYKEDGWERLGGVSLWAQMATINLRFNGTGSWGRLLALFLNGTPTHTPCLWGRTLPLSTFPCLLAA